jgi:acetyltransferase-like isoleucine patch superfamily enzyme
MNRFGQNVSLSGDAVLGDGITIGNNVTVYSGTRIGDGCRIFDGAVLGRPPVATSTMNRVLAESKPLVIDRGVIIGANAVLYEGTTIGPRTLIGDLATLREGCQVAADAVVGRAVIVMYDTRIGERSRIIDGAILTGRMTIEADVFIGPGANSINDNDVYLRRFGLEPCEFTGPTVRRFALVGAGAILGAEIEIGMGAIVAPGAMVTRDVPPWTVVAGVPARVLREVDADQRARILARVGISHSSLAS